MTILKKDLIIRQSQISGAGKGLFTKCFIPKGTQIIEYKGRITTWKDVCNGDVFNPYVYYVTRNYVIDAMQDKKQLARYINDARGITRITGLKNNTKYVEEGKRVYTVALRNIEAGEEILVSYGKEYWDVIRGNKKLESKK